MSVVRKMINPGNPTVSPTMKNKRYSFCFGVYAAVDSTMLDDLSEWFVYVRQMYEYVMLPTVTWNKCKMNAPILHYSLFCKTVICIQSLLSNHQLELCTDVMVLAALRRSILLGGGDAALTAQLFNVAFMYLFQKFSSKGFMLCIQTIKSQRRRRCSRIGAALTNWRRWSRIGGGAHKLAAAARRVRRRALSPISTVQSKSYCSVMHRKQYHNMQ